jgi:hypothetical protein
MNTCVSRFEQNGLLAISALVFADGTLLLLGILLVESIESSLGFANGLLALGLALLISLGNILSLTFTPLSNIIRIMSTCLYLK